MNANIGPNQYSEETDPDRRAVDVAATCFRVARFVLVLAGLVIAMTAEPSPNLLRGLIVALFALELIGRPAWMGGIPSR
jgi:hypothetical protein